jgi:hypothetical protein
MNKFGLIGWSCFILVLAGAINIGLIGFLNLDLIGLFFGKMSLISRLIFIVIGASAGYLIHIVFLTKEKPE